MSSHSRYTLAPNDLLSRQVSSPRRGNISKISSAANTTLSSSSKRLELENNELELAVCYNDYLAAAMEEFVVKQQVAKKDKSMCSLLKTVTKETNVLHGKCSSMKIREEIMRNLITSQNNLDKYLVKAHNFTESWNDNLLHTTLSQLKEALQRYDVLCCENIVLPTTPELLEKFKKSLQDCKNSLQLIDCAINDNKEPVHRVNTDLNNLITLLNESHNLYKISQRKACNLESEVLCSCSYIISQN